MATTRPDGLLPWQQNLWEHCLSLICEQQLPQAIILHSERGFGITGFSQRVADAILCHSEKEKPCGECLPCRTGKTRDNPDFFLIQPQEEHGVLKIIQIRALTDFLSTTTHYGRKVVLVSGAEQMNTAAANALLKTLEEPPGYATIILVCHFPSLLLPTIRSRCCTLHLSPPSNEVMVAWLRRESDRDEETCLSHLNAASGMPLLALETLCANQDARQSGRKQFFASVEEFLQGHTELTQVSANWEKASVRQVQHWLLERIESEIRAHYTHLPETRLSGTSDDAIGLLFKLYEQQKQRCHPHNNNLTPRLLLEKALFELEFVMRRSRVPNADTRTEQA